MIYVEYCQINAFYVLIKNQQKLNIVKLISKFFFLLTLKKW